MSAPLALAFAAGLLATFNPCGFALLPAYLAYFVGVAGEKPSSPLRATGRAIVVSATLTLGFAAVFGVVGIIVSIASVQVARIAPWLTVVMAAGLVVLGVALFRGYEPKLSLPRLSRGASRDGGLPGIFVFGVSYATVSLSCTLPPFLAAVVTTFEDTSVVGGIVTFLLYAAGMGSVLSVLSVAVAVAQRQVVDGLRRGVRHVHRASGVLLVLAGSYAAWYGTYELILNAGHDVPAGPVATVTAISGRVSRWTGEAGPVTIGIGAGVVLLAALGVAAVASRPETSPAQRG